MAVARAGLLVLAFGLHNAQAEENCGSWRPADVDPTKGKFDIELRVCDLPYGLSAYIQLMNASQDRVALSYRLMMKDHSSKDNDIVIEAGGMLRAETCQACAKRYSGLESWQILSAKSLGKSPVQPAVIPDTTATVKSPAPAATAPVPAEVAKPEPPKVAEKVVPAHAEPQTVEKKPPVDGFRTEDGTIIPWDQMPPEFRPRK